MYTALLPFLLRRLFCSGMQKACFSTLCLQWLWDLELQAGYKVLLPRTDSRERLPRIAVRIPQGINKTALELDDLDRLISPLLKQGQPLNHIYATHEDEIVCSKRSIYHYLEQGGPVLLTMLFCSCNFMLIFLLVRNTQTDVCEVFEAIETVLGTEKMRKLFEAVLTDNGAGFKNPTLLERNLSGQRRMHIFYCDPMASWQKGRFERNHEFIRYILPKGRPFTSLTKAQVITIMNHINSTARASLNARTPFELVSLLLPEALYTGPFFCITSSYFSWLLLIHLT